MTEHVLTLRPSGSSYDCANVSLRRCGIGTVNPLQRKLILLAEAGSVVGQCTAVLGVERTNRISAELDAAREELLAKADANA